MHERTRVTYYKSKCHVHLSSVLSSMLVSPSGDGTTLFYEIAHTWRLFIEPLDHT